MKAKPVITVVGLGYVGLPLAHLLAEHFEVHGYDISKEKISQLRAGIDPTHEVGDAIKSTKMSFHDDPDAIGKADFVIVAVPTPVNPDKSPDLSPVESATRMVAKHMKPGTIVSYESTVYPGLTREFCLPLLEQESGMRFGTDFKLAYSPERVNPGDKVHTIDNIVKVVSGSDAEALDAAAQVYGSITKVHRAPTIEVAEAAKVIENTYRDVNIGLTNELSVIFHALGIDTHDVLTAAATKWNFVKYTPGLVGGHCIGVDPYYLAMKAQSVGIPPQMILAGRARNEAMVEHVAMLALEQLADGDKPLGKSRIGIMGLTFKEDCNDVRNSKIIELAELLKKKFHVSIAGYDPHANPAHARMEGFTSEFAGLDDLMGVDAVIVGSPHREIRNLPASYFKSIMKDPVVIDIKGVLDKDALIAEGVRYVRL